MVFEDLKGDRIARVLSIYTRLLDGEIVNKTIVPQSSMRY